MMAQSGKEPYTLANHTLDRPSYQDEPQSTARSIVRIESATTAATKPGCLSSRRTRGRGARSLVARNAPVQFARHGKNGAARSTIGSTQVFEGLPPPLGKTGHAKKPRSGDLGRPAELHERQPDGGCYYTRHEVEQGHRSSLCFGHDWPHRLIAICRSPVAAVSCRSRRGLRCYWTTVYTLLRDQGPGAKLQRSMIHCALTRSQLAQLTSRPPRSRITYPCVGPSRQRSFIGEHSP